MHKQKRTSNRGDDDDGEFDYGEEPKGRSGEDSEEEEEDAASLADDADDPQPLDRLVKLKWRN